MNPALLLGFVGAAFVIIVIPGPSVLFTVGRALALGRRAGIVSVLATVTGSFVLATVVSLGVGALILASDVVYLVIRYAGAAYLVFLGVQTIVQRRRSAAATMGDSGPQSLRRVYLQALAVSLTNPKTIAFFIAILPQFADPTRPIPVPLQMEVMAVIFAALGFCSDGAWALAAAGARQWFGRSPRRLETLTAIGGAVMIALGLVLALLPRI